MLRNAHDGSLADSARHGLHTTAKGSPQSGVPKGTVNERREKLTERCASAIFLSDQMRRFRSGFSRLSLTNILPLNPGRIQNKASRRRDACMFFRVCFCELFNTGFNSARRIVRSGLRHLVAMGYGPLKCRDGVAVGFTGPGSAMDR